MKIALIGYGKMGRMIEEIALSRGHEIVSIIDIDNQEEFQSAAFASADVAIEFTTPWTAYDNYLKAWAAGVKVDAMDCVALAREAEAQAGKRNTATTSARHVPTRARHSSGPPTSASALPSSRPSTPTWLR